MPCSQSLAAGFAASQLGLVERPRGSGLRDWPYPEAGHGSLTANVVVWLSILVLTAFLIRGLLADLMQWPVSTLPIFVVLAITGFAPFIPRGLLDVPWAIGLLATSALLRLAPDCSPPATPMRATAVLLAAGTLVLCASRACGAAPALAWVTLQPTDSSGPPRGIVELTDVPKLYFTKARGSVPRTSRCQFEARRQEPIIRYEPLVRAGPENDL